MMQWTYNCARLFFRVSINLKVMANFSDQLFATHVVIKIPVPKNTAKAKIKHSFGRASMNQSNKQSFGESSDSQARLNVTLLPMLI
jgi:hypothetical protein